MNKFPRIQLRELFTDADGRPMYPGELPSVRLPVKGGSKNGELVQVTRVSAAEVKRVLEGIGFNWLQRLWGEKIVGQGRSYFGVDPLDKNTILRDTGEPYHYHLRAVALILIYELKEVDPNIVLAAFGHDFMEDLSVLRELNPGNSEFTPVDFLTEAYNAVVADIIRAQTKPKIASEVKGNMTPQQRHEYKMGIYRTLMTVLAEGNSPEDNVKVKLADRVHNLRTANTEAMRKKKTLETLRYLVPIVRHYLSDSHLSLLMEALEPGRNLLSRDELDMPEVNYWVD